MGVIGLQTYVESLPDVFRLVDISQMAAEYRKLHPEMQGNPTIVMDAYNCLRFWKKNLERIHDGPWIYGGQFVEYKKMLKDFLYSFKNIGVEVVFYFSGLLRKHDRERWLNDYMEIANNSQITFQQIETSELLDPDFGMTPPALSTVIPLALKYIFHANVYWNLEGGSRPVASFAVENNCMAILAQDTDYIILPTVSYISMQHLDLKTMHTRQYCREAMCRELGMEIWMLPLFACMIGKDKDSLNKRFSFHNNIRGLRNVCGFQRTVLTIQSVARCITNYAFTTQEDLTMRLPELYTTCGIENAISLDELQKGIDTYSMTNTEYKPSTLPGIDEKPQNDDIYEVILRKVKNFNLSPMIANVLCIGREIRYPCLENSNSFDTFPPCVLVYRPIRQRMYALIFELKDNYLFSQKGNLLPTENIVEEWWINTSVNDKHDNSIVSPLPVKLPDGISNATVLYDIIMDNDEHLLDKKWAVLMACLELTMSFTTFQDIPHHYKSLCATLNYLIQQQDVKIKMWEMEVFLLQAIHPKFKDNHWQTELPFDPYYNSRAVHLVTLFLKGSEAFLDLLHFSRNPIEMEYGMPWNFFSAKLFYYFYKRRSFNYTEFLENDLMFTRLKDAILEGIDLETCFLE